MTARAVFKAKVTLPKLLQLGVLSLAFALFFAMRYLLLRVDGNFIDEYFHIIVGRDWIETGRFPSFYEGEVYDRGAPMSMWVGILLWLFGQKLVVAKAAALALGTMSLGLATYIGWRAIPDRQFLLLFILLYAVSPWAIFNHTYVRFYVFVEFSVLLAVALAHPLLRGIREGRPRTSLAAACGLLGVAAFNFALQNDASKYLLLLVVGLAFALPFIFDSDSIPFRGRSAWARIAGRVFAAPPVLKALAVALSGVLVFFAAGLEDQLDFLLAADPKHSSAKDRKYDWFFRQAHPLATALFVMAACSAVFIGGRSRIRRPDSQANDRVAAEGATQAPHAGHGGDLADRYARLVVLIAAALFVLHVVSSPGIQTTRAIAYFLPLFFLGGVILLSRLHGPPRFVLCLSAGALLIYESVETTPKHFWTEPTIPREINYVAYQPAFDYVKAKCAKAAIVDASPHPFLDGFFGVEPVAVMSAAGEARRNDRYRKKGKKLVTVYGEIPVLTRLTDLASFDRDVCLIVRQASDHHFLPRSAGRLLRRAKHHKRLPGIDVYYLANKTVKAWKDPGASKRRKARRRRKARKRR